MIEFYNPDAELHLLGDMLVWNEVPGEAIRALAPEDFGTAWMRAIFEALSALHTDGLGLAYDPTILRHTLQLRGTWDLVGEERLVLLFKSPTGAWQRSLAMLAELGVRRRLFEAVETARLALAADAEAPDVLAALTEHLSHVQVPLAGGPPDGLSTVDEFLDQPSQQDRPWTVPGLFRPGWRAIVIATEGGSKSTMLSQIAVASAQGIHPFQFSKIPPIRTLMVDLENPDDRLLQGLKPLRYKSQGTDYDESRAWLLSRPGGMDLRSAKGRRDLERAIAHSRPDLVCIGPLYKCYRLSGRDSYEMVAAEVASVFDDLRSRYDFAMLIEHHAPKKASGAKTRDLDPYGSAMWSWWPEFGFKLVPHSESSQDKKKPENLEIQRFRIDRVKAAWPERFDRGAQGQWPLVGWWKDGMPSLTDEEQETF